MKLHAPTWRVLLVDDHALFRNGLRATLQRALPGSSVEEAGSASEALEKFAVHLPHLVLLDVNLPGSNGLDLARKIRTLNNQTRLLMVAAETDPWTVKEALAAGANGFIGKTSSAVNLVQAVQIVMNDQVYLCSDSQAALEHIGSQESSPASSPGPAILSTREREVLCCLARGENTKGTADLLRISPKTVETHRQHIMRKLGTNNVAFLARYAIRHGLILP